MQAGRCPRHTQPHESAFLPGTHLPTHVRSLPSPKLRCTPAAHHRRQPASAGRLSVCATAATAPAPSEARSPAEAPQPADGLRIPRCLAEIDNGKILGFGADLAEDHPVRKGFRDDAYKRRRVAIADLAREHEVGQPLPRVEYLPEEVATWQTALTELRKIYPRHACREYLDSVDKFGFREDSVLQLEDISQILQAETGWGVRPVAGLLHPRDFLNGLYFRTFHSTQYMRHHSQPTYTPEPDLVHELLGHMAMLANPDFCDLAWHIGRASLGADEKQIWHLTKIYWYTAEFGVVREGGVHKAFGAGILSSYGEMEHMAAGKAAFDPFDPFQKQPKMSYKDGYQKRYFVLDSFHEGAEQLKAYCASLHLPDNLPDPECKTL